MADIPINAVHRRAQYTSTGSAGPYSFSFAILAEGDLAIYDASSLKTLTTHYTVSITAGTGTGSITFTSGNEPTSGNIVTIISDQAVARTSDFTTSGDYRAATINDELDRITIVQQQLESVLRRAPQLDVFANRDVSDSGLGPLAWPYDDTVANNASKTVAFDSAGTALEIGPSVGDIAAAATEAAAAAASAAAALVSENAAAADAIITSADAVLTAADVVTVAATAATMTGAASTTSLAIATGSKAFTVASGLGFIAGDWVLVTSDADITNYMHGQIASYTGTTMTVTVDNIGGSGTLADWTIRRSGTQGNTGATGSTGSTGATGPTGPVGVGLSLALGG